MDSQNNIQKRNWKSSQWWGIILIVIGAIYLYQNSLISQMIKDWQIFLEQYTKDVYEYISEHTSQVKEYTAKLQNQINEWKSVKASFNEIAKDLEKLRYKIDELKIRLEKQNLLPYKKVVHLFPIYKPDKQAQHLELGCYVAIPEALPLREKLEIIADALSRYKFAWLPIKVRRIEKRNNKKIAIIELYESEKKREPRLTWCYGFFQGSTGGYFTEQILLRGFLQPGYKGEWIDGVRFYYEGKPMEEYQWDHVCLDGIIYRDKIF